VAIAPGRRSAAAKARVAILCVQFISVSPIVFVFDEEKVAKG
jgi:hypothetical protein